MPQNNYQMQQRLNQHHENLINNSWFIKHELHFTLTLAYSKILYGHGPNLSMNNYYFSNWFYLKNYFEVNDTSITGSIWQDKETKCNLTPLFIDMHRLQQSYEIVWHSTRIYKGESYKIVILPKINYKSFAFTWMSHFIPRGR